MTNTPKRALVYTRDASRFIDEGGEEQLRACMAYAREHGLHVVAHYDDHGSGLATGEGLRSLWSTLGAVEADVILVRDAHRLSRVASTLFELLRDAARLGVVVISLDSGELDEDQLRVRSIRWDLR